MNVSPAGGVSSSRASTTVPCRGAGLDKTVCVARTQRSMETKRLHMYVIYNGGKRGWSATTPQHKRSERDTRLDDCWVSQQEPKKTHRGVPTKCTTCMYTEKKQKTLKFQGNYNTAVHTSFWALVKFLEQTRAVNGMTYCKSAKTLAAPFVVTRAAVSPRVQ